MFLVSLRSKVGLKAHIKISREKVTETNLLRSFSIKGDNWRERLDQRSFLPKVGIFQNICMLRRAIS